MHWMEVNGQHHTLATLPLEKEPSIPFGGKDWWATALVSVFLKRDKTLASLRIQTLDIQVCTLITILTIPSLLQ
jgi:hypothetical protein